jgi:hypothetical protein
MIHLVSGFIKAGLKIRRQTILFAAVAVCLPVAATAQGISAPPGLVAPLRAQILSACGLKASLLP